MATTEFGKCPGPERSAPPSPENFSCPGCGAEVEIWTDEKKRKCPQCGELVKKEDAKKA
jgi:hypothetical protein